MTRLDLIRDSLQELLSNFIPITVVIRNKKLQISEETLQNIQEAESAITYATETNIPLPKSTFELCHLGTAIRDKIFPIIEEYQVEQSTKRRARRKGSWQLKVIGWNEKKIKFDIKKYPEPKWEGKKLEKDEKFFRWFTKDWPAQLDRHAIAVWESKVHQLGNIFINPASPITQKVKELERALKDYSEAEKDYQKAKLKLKNANEKHQILSEETKDLAIKVQALNAKISNKPEHKRLMADIKQLQHLQEERKTRSFLKIWRDLLHRYIRWAQRELGSPLPLKDLSLIEEDFLDSSVPLEDLYDDISAEFIAKAELLFAQRKQFAKKVGSQTQLRGRLENGKPIILKLRKLQGNISDAQAKLAAIDDFREANELESKLNKKEEEYTTCKEELKRHERSASELKGQMKDAHEIFSKKIKKKL
ncbi:MAG: hypothetical protein ACE5OZ_00385 [Candidatus Heimdallarchaeota archaeon]